MTTKSDQVLEVAVVGVGRMGRHHARTYAQLPGAKLVGVADSDTDRAETVADEFGCMAYDSVEAVMATHPNIAAVSIAVPTHLHAQVAQPLLEQRVACLIEKPLAATVAEAKYQADLASKYGAVLQVGHTERFNPAVRAVAAMDLIPRYMEVDRVCPMSFRSLDVGVVMDMMIHDLDIMLMLARSPIKKIDATGLAVFGEHEDVCSARIVFECGCVATLTASRLAMKTERRLRMFSEDAYVSLNYQKRDGVVVRRSQENLAALEMVRTLMAEGKDLSDMDYSELIQVDELKMDLPADEEDPLTAQLNSFLATARTGSSPAVTAEAGYAAVEAAERVIAAIKAHKWDGIKGSEFGQRALSV